MKLELKNVKINEEFSQETTMFKGDLYVDNVKVAYASNDGYGGATNYNAYTGQAANLAKAEEYAKTLTSPYNENEKSNLEDWIDDAIFNMVEQKAISKANKQIQKACNTHIVWGVPNTGAYSKIGFKGKHKIEDLIKVTQGKVALQNLLNKVKKELKTNEVIFNKNLTDLIW